MSFTAELQIFDGPLDLMLHLIREQKLDIFDLDMEVLCDQYLAYLEKLEDLQLEVESEYLVHKDLSYTYAGLGGEDTYYTIYVYTTIDPSSLLSSGETEP